MGKIFKGYSRDNTKTEIPALRLDDLNSRADAEAYDLLISAIDQDGPRVRLGKLPSRKS